MKKQNKKRIIFFVMAMLFFITGCGKETITFSSEEEVSSGDFAEQDTIQSAAKEDFSQTQIVVYVCGAVKKPGVYEFQPGARVCDAIEAAGGMKKKAGKEALNLARLLEDGEQITVPLKEEMQENVTLTEEEPPSGALSAGSKVNINTASKEELMTLSGIGEAKAESIISYREKNGRFTSIEDIMKIDGIKEGVFSKLEDSICVN